MTSPLGLRALAATVRESALRRLGKPLLLWWLALLVFGVVVVLACVAWMFLGWRLG
jgi:hypothetical protein